MSNFNFGNVTNLDNFFQNFSSLESVDLSNANTTNVVTMQNMFKECTNLSNLNLIGIDTSKVHNMNFMFYNCSSLKELDLSSFDTSSLLSSAGCPWMFGNCSLLEKIYVNPYKWNISNQPNDMSIFGGNTNLVGGNGTTFDSSKVNKTYAIIDGTDGKPGYLTDIADKPSN